MIDKKKSKKRERAFFIQNKKSAKLPFKKKKKHKALINFKKIYKELNFKQYKHQGGDAIFKNLVYEFQNSELKKIMKGGNRKQKKMNLIIKKLERALIKFKNNYDLLIQALKNQNSKEFKNISNKFKLQASGIFGNKPIMKEIVVNLLKFRKAELKINTNIKRNEFKESKKLESATKSDASPDILGNSSGDDTAKSSAKSSESFKSQQATPIFGESNFIKQGGFFQSEEHTKIENIMRAGFLERIFGEKKKMMDYTGIDFSKLQNFGIKQNPNIFNFKALKKTNNTMTQNLQSNIENKIQTLSNELRSKLDVTLPNLDFKMSDKLDDLVYLSLRKPIDVVRYDLGFLEINPNAALSLQSETIFRSDNRLPIFVRKIIKSSNFKFNKEKLFSVAQNSMNNEIIIETLYHTCLFYSKSISKPNQIIKKTTDMMLEKTNQIKIILKKILNNIDIFQSGGAILSEQIKQNYMNCNFFNLREYYNLLISDFNSIFNNIFESIKVSSITSTEVIKDELLTEILMS